MLCLLGPRPLLGPVRRTGGRVKGKAKERRRVRLAGVTGVAEDTTRDKTGHLLETGHRRTRRSPGAPSAGGAQKLNSQSEKKKIIKKKIILEDTNNTFQPILQIS